MLNADLGTFRVGVDFGTSNTVAMVGWPDGRARPVLFDGAPLLPSAVFADPSGDLLVGRDAVHAALSYPERFEPYPKRRIDDGVLLLGDAELPVAEAIAAVLRRVMAETQRVAGQQPTEFVLTFPAAWGARRRGVLLDGAARAGIHGPRLVPEPLAAAFHFANLLGARVPHGGHLLVYDFGAGTFDASVVRRTADGFAVLASEGLADTGGLDVDAAFVAHLGAVYGGRHPEAWRRLEHPGSAADRRHNRQLWDGVRAAKEALSRTDSALVHIPVLEQAAPISRDQLEQLARAVVDRTVTAARGALLDATVDLRQVAGVVLVGGASRMPIVATQLQRVLGVAPTVLEQPELVVAEGSLLAASHEPAAAPDAAPPSWAPAGAGNTAPRDTVTVSAGGGAQAPTVPDAGDTDAPTVVMQPVRPAAASRTAESPAAGRRRRVMLVVAVAAAVVLLAAIGLVVGKVLPPLLREGGGGNGGEWSARDVGFHTPGAGVSASGVPAQSGRPGTTASGVPSGGPGASGGASPRPGTSSGGVKPGATTKKPGGIQGTPAPRQRTNEEELKCEGIGVPLTTPAGGRLPEVRFTACVQNKDRYDPPSSASADWYMPWWIDYENHHYRSRMVVETYTCAGALVDRVDTGVVEKDGSSHTASIDSADYSGSFYIKAKLTVLELRLDGVLWKGSSVTVTSACQEL